MGNEQIWQAVGVIVAWSHCLPGVEAAVCVYSLKGRKLISGIIPFINIQLPLQNTIKEKWTITNYIDLLQRTNEVQHLLQAKKLGDITQMLHKYSKYFKGETCQI